MEIAGQTSAGDRREAGDRHVAAKTKQRQGYQSIRIEPHEWQLAMDAGKEYDMGASRFIVLVLRNWLMERPPLRLVRPFPK